MAPECGVHILVKYEWASHHLFRHPLTFFLHVSLAVKYTNTPTLSSVSEPACLVLCALPVLPNR